MASSKPNRSPAWLLNLGLVAAGAVLLVLLYALVARVAFPRVETNREQNPAELVGTIIQVDVRNGCGVSGIAETATRYLREQGFDVVETGNHHTFAVEETHVLDRVGNPEAAAQVARAMGLPPERVREAIDLDIYLDVSLILGQDYARFAPFDALSDEQQE